MVDGRENAKASSVAKGYQDPDFGEGHVDASGCVTLRASHLRVIALGALKVGKFEAWTSKMPSARRMDLFAMFSSRPCGMGSIEFQSYLESAPTSM